MSIYFCSISWAQKYQPINLPNADNEKLHYGFVIGFHASKFKINYSQRAINSQDSLKAIRPTNTPGFSLSFLVNKKIGDFFDVRIMPGAGFYQNSLKYTFNNSSSTVIQVTDKTYAELPVLIKYKSERRKNFRMYLIGGVRPSFEVTSKDEKDLKDRLSIEKINFAVDYGVGCDIYYPMFKFSPEIRVSQGLNNMVSPVNSYYNSKLESIKTNSVSLYLIFN